MASAFEPPPTYASVVLYDERAQDTPKLLASVKFNPIWLKWFVDLSALLSVAGGGGGSGFSHNSTTGLQGGTANQYYHFTAAEHTKLQTLASPTPISATITTAKLTGPGANGSMTFTNGLLTASTPAT